MNDCVFSVHNHKLGRDNIAARIRPNPLYDSHSPFDPDNDVDYKTVLFYPEKATFTAGFDLAPDWAPTCTHSNLIMCHDEARITEMHSSLTSVKLIDNVKRMLSVMRIFSFQ